MKKLICLLAIIIVIAIVMLTIGYSLSVDRDDDSSIRNDKQNGKENVTSYDDGKSDSGKPSKASYLGTWENVGYSEYTVTINSDSTLWLTIYEDYELLAEVEYAYQETSDEYYKYLECRNADTFELEMVLILIGDDVIAGCSTDLENNYTSDWYGDPVYNKHIGISPLGNKYYGGECSLFVRKGTPQKQQIPSHADREQIAEWCCLDDADDLKYETYIYYPGCSLLIVNDTPFGDMRLYIWKNGDVTQAEGVGIKHLNGYFSDDIMTDSNIVITDSK